MNELIESASFQQGVMAALGLASIGGGIAVGIVARLRHDAAIVVAIAAALTWFVGLSTAGLGVAHLFGVIWTATQRAIFVWDFRFGALLLLGLNLVAAGTLCLASVRGLQQGRASVWLFAVAGTFWLFVVNWLVRSVQPGFANVLMPLAIMNLVILLLARLQLGKAAGSGVV